MSDFQSAYDRIREATGLRTQCQVAEELGVRQSSVSDAKHRNSVPDQWLVTLLDKHALNPTWILSGEGPRYLTGSDIQPPSPPDPQQRASLRLEPVLKAALLAAIPAVAEALREALAIPVPDEAYPGREK